VDAIIDFSKALELNPKKTDAMYQRGMAKIYSFDNSGACADLKLAKELGSTEAILQITKSCK
jgi:hypothetical protein